jgi:ribosome-binding factor A
MGFVTICRAEVDKEMQKCVVYWSLIGDDTRRRLSEAALANATGFLRKEVAQVLHTRSVPVLEFRFDESVVGAERMRGLLDELRLERGDPDPDDPDGKPAGDADGEPAGDAAGEPEGSPDGERDET